VATNRWDAFTDDELWDLLYALEWADPQRGADETYMARANALVDQINAEVNRRENEAPTPPGGTV
jgi:hypothetical protein